MVWYALCCLSFPVIILIISTKNNDERIRSLAAFTAASGGNFSAGRIGRGGFYVPERENQCHLGQPQRVARQAGTGRLYYHKKEFVGKKTRTSCSLTKTGRH